jgi:hypothetical protein
MFISPIRSQNQGFQPTCKALSPLQQQTMDLQVFYHHIYEYKKGLRNLVLTTEKQEYRSHIEDRLKGNKIDYVIQDVNTKKMNVFFGAKDCVEVVKTFIDKKLNKLSPEQDFILGIMLGYDRLKQCARYLDFKNKNGK